MPPSGPGLGIGNEWRNGAKRTLQRIKRLHLPPTIIPTGLAAILLISFPQGSKKFTQIILYQISRGLVAIFHTEGDPGVIIYVEEDPPGKAAGHSPGKRIIEIGQK